MATLTPRQKLKFILLADGVRVHPSARAAWVERFDGPITLAEYATTSGVSLVLPGDLYVNAPEVTDGEAPELRFADDGFSVATRRDEVPVRVVPVPAFHGRTQIDAGNGTAQRYSNYGVTHTDRVRVSPITGCAWKCHFCDLPYEFAYERKDEGNLLATIIVAQDDPLVPARHVLVSGGTPRAPIRAGHGRLGRDDEAWIDGVYAYLAEHSPLPVDVMMPPRRDLGHPERLRAAGVNSVSINLEVYDPTRAQAVAPVKAKLSREHCLDYIERAVEAFGVGFVQSLMVFGEAIEPLQSTLAGVEALVERGCVPVLSAFRPHHLTPLATAPAATFEEMTSAYLRTLEICDRLDNGVRPGPRCIPCQHNTVALPDDSGFYVGLDADLADRRCPTY